MTTREDRHLFDLNSNQGQALSRKSQCLNQFLQNSSLRWFTEENLLFLDKLSRIPLQFRPDLMNVVEFCFKISFDRRIPQKYSEKLKNKNNLICNNLMLLLIISPKFRQNPFSAVPFNQILHFDTLFIDIHSAFQTKITNFKFILI